MKAVWYILTFVVGGVVGLVIGGVGGGTVGMMAGGIGGTELGVCTTVQVAQDKGILDAEQQQRLLEETATYLRTEFKELVDKTGLSEEIPLNAETCEKIKGEIKANS